MVAYLSIVISALLKSLAVAAAAIYVGMVMMRYRTDGPQYPLSFEFRDPAGSVQHLVVWLGVRVADVCLRMAKVIFNMLLEASAEVGEWFMRRSPAVRQSVRSRFMV